MSLDAGLSGLIQQIYRADSDADWRAVGHGILHRTGACVGLQTTVDLGTGEFEDFRFFGKETSRIDQATVEYPDIKQSDPTLIWAVDNPQAGYCSSEAAVCSQDYLNHPFVVWNKSRFGATHWYVCYSRPDDGFSHSLSIHVPADQGAAAAEQIAQLKLLFEQQQNAAWLQRRPLDSAEQAPWLVLDGAGTIRAISQGCEALLATGDGLSVLQRRLYMSSPASSRRSSGALPKSGPPLNRVPDLRRYGSSVHRANGPGCCGYDRC